MVALALKPTKHSKLTDSKDNMDRLLSKLSKLVDVKSIITILLVLVLCICTLNGTQTSELFNSAVMLVLGFFFGKKLAQSE